MRASSSPTLGEVSMAAHAPPWAIKNKPYIWTSCLYLQENQDAHWSTCWTPRMGKLPSQTNIIKIMYMTITCRNLWIAVSPIGLYPPPYFYGPSTYICSATLAKWWTFGGYSYPQITVVKNKNSSLKKIVDADTNKQWIKLVKDMVMSYSNKSFVELMDWLYVLYGQIMPGYLMQNQE